MAEILTKDMKQTSDSLNLIQKRIADLETGLKLVQHLPECNSILNEALQSLKSQEKDLQSMLLLQNQRLQKIHEIIKNDDELWKSLKQGDSIEVEWKLASSNIDYKFVLHEHKGWRLAKVIEIIKPTIIRIQYTNNTNCYETIDRNARVVPRIRLYVHK
jgi:hypothetical protein